MRKANLTSSENPNVVDNNHSNRNCRTIRPPPFLGKLYQMVMDPETNEIVSWSLSRQSFIIWDRDKFSLLVLPKYFRHNSFHCFLYQLKNYGFSRVGLETNPIEFANPLFVEGREDWLMMIIRRQYTENVGAFSQRKDNLHNRTLMEATTEILSSPEKMNLELQLEELRQKQKNMVDQFTPIEDNKKTTLEDQESLNSALIAHFVHQSVIQHVKENDGTEESVPKKQRLACRENSPGGDDSPEQ